MNTTIDVICYKSKVLKNNENPLMLRVTKDRKRRYLSIGISVNPQYWDFDKNKPKRNCPNKDLISKIISDKIQAYRDQIMELKSDKKEFTAKTLIEKVHQPTKRKTVQEMFDSQIERLFAEKRRGYALSHQHVLSSLLAFNKHLDIYFSDIDVAWLQRYETWLRSNDIAVNTIGIRFRTLRAVFNVAIRENCHNNAPHFFYRFQSGKINFCYIALLLTFYP